METMRFAKDIPVSRSVEVLVVGAGPAGIGAAVSAARNGAEVLLIEQGGCVGGAATLSWVGPFMTSFDAKDEFMVIRGVFEELVRRMIALGGAIDPALVPAEHPWSGFYRIGHAHVGPFSDECMKRVATEMVLESGVSLLLHTQFLEPLLEDGRIVGAVVANKSGVSAIRAKAVVDCSGDADVAARAGVPYVLGNVDDGNLQPATLFLKVYGVDTERLKKHIAEHREEILPFYGPFAWLIKEKAEEWGDVPRAEVCLFEGPEPGEYRLNVTRILDVDGTDAADLTRAELEGLRQAHKVFAFLKRNAVGFENARLIGTAPVVGVRETRHIAGIRTVTMADVKACLVPSDSIAVLATNMDTHNRNDPGGTFHTHTAGRYFGVPYGSLVPVGVENLLVAGRALSADSVAASATRMIPCCLAFGQAAGLAAAMSVRTGVRPADLDVAEIRRVLVEQGAYLGK